MAFLAKHVAETVPNGPRGTFSRRYNLPLCSLSFPINPFAEYVWSVCDIDRPRVLPIKRYKTRPSAPDSTEKLPRFKCSTVGLYVCRYINNLSIHLPSRKLRNRFHFVYCFTFRINRYQSFVTSEDFRLMAVIQFLIRTSGASERIVCN